MTRDKILTILSENEILPKKIFGQNFLCDDGLCELIAEEATSGINGPVIEIGPGIGAVTEYLIDIAPSVTAVEIDKELSEYLSDSARLNGLRLITNDYLKLRPEEYDAGIYKCAVSNIPYYVTTPIMIKMMTELINTEQMIFMVEKAALDRICAMPGTKQYGPLAVVTALYGSLDILTNVGPDSFYPAPHTVSSVIKITANKEYHVLDDEFVSFLEACFSQRRKKLSNSIQTYKNAHDLDNIVPYLKELGLREDVRSEDITPSDFARLYISWTHK